MPAPSNPPKSAPRPLVPDPTPADLARYRNPARVAAFVASLAALGIEIHADHGTGRVDLIGAAVSPLLEEETRCRAAGIIELQRQNMKRTPMRARGAVV